MNKKAHFDGNIAVILCLLVVFGFLAFWVNAHYTRDKTPYEDCMQKCYSSIFSDTEQGKCYNACQGVLNTTITAECQPTQPKNCENGCSYAFNKLARGDNSVVRIGDLYKTDCTTWCNEEK